MKRLRPRRLSVEVLEDRCCPSLTVTSLNGNLTISGTANSGSITVKETSSNTIEVDDGSTPVSTVNNVTNVTANLTSANDKVTVNLGGNTLTGNLTTNLSNGTNVVSVVNGTIGGNLNATGGFGNDTVVFGEAADTLTVNGNASFNLGNGANTLVMQNGTVNGTLTYLGSNFTDNIGLGDTSGNALTVGGNATFTTAAINSGLKLFGGVDLQGSLTTNKFNNVTLNSDSLVEQTATFNGLASGNTIELDGAIAGTVAFNAPSQSSTGTSKLTVGKTASLGNDLNFTSSLLNLHGNVLDIEGQVAHDVTFHGTNLGDAVILGAAGSVGDNLTAVSGKGNNGYLISGSVGNALALYVGHGEVNVGPTAVIGTSALVDLTGFSGQLDWSGTVGPTGGTGTALFVQTAVGPHVVTLYTATVVNGNAIVNMGGNGNLFTLNDNAIITGTLKTNGGGGNSVFHGQPVAGKHPNVSATNYGTIIP
jgi:hypothetical protein